MTPDSGADGIHLSQVPPSDAARDALLRAAAHPGKDAAPDGFRGVAALWARDRDMLVGQGVVLELKRNAPARETLVPVGWDPSHPVGLVELLCVRPEYRWIGLEERILRGLGHLFHARVPARDALIYVGEAHAPVMLSTLLALSPRTLDPLLR
ncbi:hypothetical protein [Jannaschia ovalis]|uniref:N-acetyltransferase domain-containing protein n=1 Tax=Jannaschia ovalis TaxID=3038773 RepID=A0ABY8LEG2_9RHOB|nr:hypothetical protein [Jannaschia sp. GRR-S6-38]WGH79704.1 hypothetical protein P8627_05430 [Jannaschia sp. GRR-S6-38]